MSRKLSSAIVVAMAVVLTAAPFVVAQTSGSGSTTGGTMSPGATGSTGTTGTSSSQMGTMGMDTVNATVADVNHQQNTVKLRMQGGETVEFKVPQASLSNLNKGDSVQVSIRKAEGQSGTTGAGTQQSRPESSPSGSGTAGSGTKAR